MYTRLLWRCLPAVVLAAACGQVAAAWVRIAETDQSVIYLDPSISPRTIMARVVEVACVEGKVSP